MQLDVTGWGPTPRAACRSLMFRLAEIERQIAKIGRILKREGQSEPPPPQIILNGEVIKEIPHTARYFSVMIPDQLQVDASSPIV